MDNIIRRRIIVSMALMTGIMGMTIAQISTHGDIENSGTGLASGTDVKDRLNQVADTINPYHSTGRQPFNVSVGHRANNLPKDSREIGLAIDKLAFDEGYLYVDEKKLESIRANSVTMQFIDTSLIWKGPAFATGMSKFIGCAYGSTDIKFINYWTQVTPENAGKFGSVAISADSSTWFWSPLDAAFNFAKSNHLIFKDHCLIWGQQQPSWITDSGFDSAKQANAVEQWIRLVGTRYPTLDMIDVVNEPLHTPAPYRAALGGNGSTGWDWVVWAFEKARLYLPKTKLLLNDFGIINDNSATTSYLKIIKILNDRGLIDGIGVQGHNFEIESVDTNVIKNNLDRLSATGLPVYISEFDLGNLGNSGTPNDNQQLQLYLRVFPILWRHPGVRGITFWDYIEGRIWQSTCYLVRSDGTARPALFWLAQYVKDNPTGVEHPAPNLPSHDQLEQNFPNPFNPVTNIRYRLSQTSSVMLKVFDILGREVQTLVNTAQAPGQYTVTLNGRDLDSGVYFYRLSAVPLVRRDLVPRDGQAGNFSDTKKLILVK